MPKMKDFSSFIKQMKYREITRFIIGILFISYIGDASGGKIYKWVDEKGVVHFSDHQPENPEKVKGKIEEREAKDPSPAQKKEDSKIGLMARTPIEYATNCTFTIKGSKSMGTGFFISSKGYAITSRHVIQGNLNLLAVLNDQNEFPLTVISSSNKYDLALLMVITRQKIPFLSIRDARIPLIPGERLFAIGTSAGFQATITDGVFTGFRLIKATKEKVIQFSAPINQGNSGGPLIDQNGNAVGVVNWKYLMRGGIPVSGLGFALPIECIIEEYGTYIEREKDIEMKKDIEEKKKP